MNEMRLVGYIAIAAVITMLIRFLPFLVFRNGRVPDLVAWTGKYLPSAAMAMLVIYCLKDVQFTGTYSEWFPAVCASVLTVVLHVRFRKMLVSICSGTLCYMLLIHL